MLNYVRRGTLALALLSALSAVQACEPPEPIIETRPLLGDRPDFFIEVDQLLSWDSRIRGVVVGESCHITMISSVDGRIWSGRTEDGIWAFRGELSPGHHTLTIQMRCDGIAPFTYSVDVTVRGNEGPDCRIASPLDGQVYASGSLIAFVSDVWDPDGDDLLILWDSDQDGGLIEGDEWAMSIYTPGEHQIQLSAIDEFGASCWDTVSIWIR